MTTERERFEEYIGVDAALSRIGDTYANSFTQAKWDGWQARAALAQPAQPVATRVGGWCQWCGSPSCFAANCLRTPQTGAATSALSAATQPDPAAERSTDGAVYCAEGAPMRLPDKGSAAGSGAASLATASSTLSTDGLTGNKAISGAALSGSPALEVTTPTQGELAEYLAPSTISATELSDAECERIAQEVSRKHPNAGDQEYAWECIRAGCATVAEDAARYRWLRDAAPMNLCAIAYRVRAACDYDEPDAAIDAARGKP